MESPAPAKPAPNASSGPATAAGGCLRGCLVGCGAFLGLAFVISVGIVVWFAIPYPDRPFEGWLRADDTVAGRIRLDLRDQGTWTLLESGFRQAAENKHKGLPSPLRELAIERDVAKAENLRSLGGVELWGFSEGTAQAERPLMVVPVRSYGKVVQTFFGLVTLPIPSSAVRNYKGASILVADRDAASAAPDAWGLTVFRGHAMAGQMDPTLLAGVDHVVDGTAVPGGGFIARTWPKEQTTPLALVVDNRNGTVGRVIRDLQIFVETARLSAAEAASQVPATPSGSDAAQAPEDPAQSEIRVDVGDIRDQVAASTPREPVWDGFEGLMVTGTLSSADALEVMTTWYPGSGVDPTAFPALMRDLATRVATATGLTVECRVIADDPAGLRAAFSFSGVKEMVDSMGPAPVQDQTIED